MSKKDEAPTELKRGVGDVAIEAIKAGKTNEEALDAVRSEFPNANTRITSINWYRGKLRSEGAKGDDGKKIPTARELTKRKKKEAEDPGF